MQLNNDHPIRILIAEDNAILRLGLRLVLEQENLIVVAEAVNGEEAVRLTAELRPDVIIMDLSMPVMNGIEAANLIHETDHDVKIIMFTSSENEEHIYASLSAGVNGYCLKETSVDRLVAGITIVCNGDFWLDSNIASKVLRTLPKASDDQPGNAVGGKTLKLSKEQQVSAQEKELNTEERNVLHAIVEGLTVSEIAVRSKTDELAVRDIERNILSKLAVANRVQDAAKTLKGSPDGESGLKKTCGDCGREFDEVFKCCPYDGSELSAFIKDQLVGTTFADRYEIVSRLGSGGMSVVYKARHKFLNRFVALKILNARLVSDVNNARRFREEAEAASLMDHPNVIKIFDFGLNSNGEAYLAMDYLEGESLNDLIEKSGPLTIDRAVSIFIQVCVGLSELHRHRIIHRDLKPGNIMLINRDGVERVCLIDFGIARSLNPGRRSQLTGDGVILGSPSYLSPEQAQGTRLDARSDIYSLGCTMYETLSGTLPFSSLFPWETMLQHVKEPAVPLALRAPQLHIPKQLDDIVMRTLEKDPAQRFQTADDLQAALSALWATLPG